MDKIEIRVEELLAKMTLREKIAQMSQVNSGEKNRRELAAQGLGSILNESNPAEANELQRVAVEESRLGIPLIFGRDVIHGFRTVFPIPLGQAASWNTGLVEKAASVAAKEAANAGVHWTFSPMVDICRDPRWGRIAEGCGEDPLLAGEMGAAMVRGYQGESLAHPESIAACAKHFVAYGATEGGRDYNSTDVPERTLRDVYLRPFKACVDAGVATFMSGFNDIDGVPATGNAFTLRQVLRDEWNFRGFVVSDWQSVSEMIVHGFCADKREAAREAANAGVDMEMVSDCYFAHLETLIASGEVPMTYVDDSVRAILRIKFRLGLFENPYLDIARTSIQQSAGDLDLARQLARESCVLLKNEGSLLPLKKDLASLAIIGPMADSPVDQMGCWVLDGKADDVRTPLAAIREAVSSSTQVRYVRGVPDMRSSDTSEIYDAVSAAAESDAVIMFLGESEKFSGEAHSRAFLDLPGAQQALVEAVQATGKPVVVVLMAGRPMTFPWMAKNIPSLLFAWHPGTMGGPAIADLLFGDHAPTGKLPVSFPRTVGQIPLYYNHKNTGRPPLESLRDVPMGTVLDPVGFCSNYLDAEHTPEFPFGFGLSYTTIEYGPAEVTQRGPGFHITAKVTNTGTRATSELVQLYTHDIAASVTRPVKELKGFQRIELAPGETRAVEFTLTPADLAFHTRKGQLAAEPGDFEVWISGNSATGTAAKFNLPVSLIEAVS